MRENKAIIGEGMTAQEMTAYCDRINASLGPVKPWPEWTQYCHECGVALEGVPENGMSRTSCLAEDYSNLPYEHSCKYHFCEDHRENHFCEVARMIDERIAKGWRLYRHKSEYLGVKWVPPDRTPQGVFSESWWTCSPALSGFALHSGPNEWEMIPVSDKRLNRIREDQRNEDGGRLRRIKQA